MMKFVGNLWAFMFKTKTWQVCLIAQEKLNSTRTPLMKLRHPKETPKDIILELIAADVGANRGCHWEILPQ